MNTSSNIQNLLHILREYGSVYWLAYQAHTLHQSQVHFVRRPVIGDNLYHIYISVSEKTDFILAFPVRLPF